MSDSVDLALGILDHQLVDADGYRCGKVDDLELEGIREGAPHVAAILVGRRRHVHVPWSEVEKVDAAVWLKKPSGELRLGKADERAARFVAWIPGAK